MMGNSSIPKILENGWSKVIVAIVSALVASWIGASYGAGQVEARVTNNKEMIEYLREHGTSSLGTLRERVAANEAEFKTEVRAIHTQLNRIEAKIDELHDERRTKAK